MKVPDANVLLYASDAGSPLHREAAAWLGDALSGSEAVGFAWSALLALIRIATKQAIFAAPLTPGEALDRVEVWLAQPPATVIHPTRRHSELLRELLETAGTGGDLTTDAHLAALAIEHGAVLASFDGDFHRFRSLRFEYLQP